MKVIFLEATNRCNRSCRHCLRNKADPPGFLPLEVADLILSQARDLGFKAVCLTGGEVALYPHLGELLHLITGGGFDFTLVTNGYRFPERVLPLLLEPQVKERLVSVCFSLDGARAETHDSLRGPKSFREVLEGMTLCRNHRLPLALKSVVTNANRGELTELALLGARMGASEHGFLYTLPTPTLIGEGLLPFPQEMQDTVRWIQDNLMGVTRNRITVEGHSMNGVSFSCGHLMDFLNVDYQGNLIFCCNLSHMTLGDWHPHFLRGGAGSRPQGHVFKRSHCPAVSQGRRSYGGQAQQWRQPQGRLRDPLSLVLEIFRQAGLAEGLSRLSLDWLADGRKQK